MYFFKILITLLFYINNINCFQISGINYNTRIGADWEPNNCKSSELIETELTIIKNITNNIKIFSLIDCNQSQIILNFAKKINLKIWLGLWISNDTTIFNKEKKELDRLIKLDLINNNIISGINVGSESIYRKEVTIEQNINYMLNIKNMLYSNNIDIPISIVEIIDIYIDFPIIADMVDVIIFNQFPFWEKISINKSIIQFDKKLKKLKKILKIKKL